MSDALPVEKQTLPELFTEESLRPVLGVQIFETDPNGIKFHGIWDHELESLMVVERPIDLALATGAGGAFVGLFPAIYDAFEHILKNSINQRDYFLSMVAVSCAVSAAIFGLRAVKSGREAARILKNIRSRPTKPHRRQRQR
jgi:hypothetical protein